MTKQWTRILSCFAAAFCGGISMIIEMTGARVLAAHVGTSAAVWTALIGTMLAFLSLGAYAGGKAADRCPDRALFAKVLFASAMATLLSAVFHGDAGNLSTWLMRDLRLAAMTGSFFILAVPAFFLGMATPILARIEISDTSSSGSAVGRISALSAMGSVAGTFLGGFFLPSYMGNTAILLSGYPARRAFSSFPSRSRRSVSAD